MQKNLDTREVLMLERIKDKYQTHLGYLYLDILAVEYIQIDEA